MAEGLRISETDSRNYLRLQNLLNTTANEFFRQRFLKHWGKLQISEWKNCAANGDEFLQGPGRELFSNSKGIQRKYLKTGNINLWDLPLLLDAVRCLEDKLGLGMQSKKYFDELKSIRNKLSHLGSLEIQSADFEKYWASISEILLALGIADVELETAKGFTLQNEIVPSAEDIVNEANRKKAETLKERGNALVKQKNYIDAIIAYTEACSIPDLPSNYLAVIYSNRSFGFLRIGDVEAAKEDAQSAMLLRPNWWRGYARLATAYLELEKYEKALHHYEIAVGMEPTANDVKESRDYCRHMVAKLARSEHLDPLNFATSFEDSAERMNRMGGIPTNAFDLAQSQKMNFSLGLPVGICGEAHNYLHGRGVAQNYETAATLFAKAAGKGSAEGLYNLAILTRDGEGVQRNISEGRRMLLEAAAQEPFAEMIPGSGIKMPNIGVMESQHALGLAYQLGVGVEKDFTRAVDWYEKALLNGSGNSGNNLALMHLQGEGVPFNVERAFEFWKVAALKGCIRAMENLAHNYQYINLMEAQKWFTLAVDGRSVTLPLQRKEFMLDEPLQDFKGEDFLDDVREDLMRGSMKEFARPTLMSFQKDLPNKLR